MHLQIVSVRDTTRPSIERLDLADENTILPSETGIIYDDWNGTEPPYNEDATVYLEALTSTSSYEQRCVPRQHEIIVNKIKEKNSKKSSYQTV